MCNLYGPTIVHEDKKGRILFENLSTEFITDESNNEITKNVFSKAQDSQKPLLHCKGELELGTSDEVGQPSSPPAIPPRTARALSLIAPHHFFGTQFRQRAGTESAVTMLSIPTADRSRRPSREEVEAVRMAFRQNPYIRVS